MKTLKVFVFLFLSILFTSCYKDLLDQLGKGGNSTPAMPHLKIAVMSDIHYLDPSLII